MLLLQRHRASKMAGGAFAFPGGRVEPADTPPDVERLCRGLTADAAARALPGVAPPERAIGFWVAALREAFEEVGLLLAYQAPGAPFVPEGAARARIADYRARCRADARAFAAMLGAEGLTLATDRMVYFAHWITPEERPVRYDTRFFVAAAFPDSVPEPDGVEAVGWRWLTPTAALAQQSAGELVMPFVTQRVLASAAGFPTVTALLDGARAAEIQPIRPRLLATDVGERILLPGEPGYF